MTPETEARFWAKVEIPAAVIAGCWEWRAGKTRSGYGTFRVSPESRGGSGKARAHRLAYQQVVGAIPPDTELDHVCRNRACVNPAHLEPVSHAENVRRGLMANNKHSAKLNQAAVDAIRLRHAAGGVSQRELAAGHGVAARTISNILAGRGWK